MRHVTHKIFIWKLLSGLKLTIFGGLQWVSQWGRVFVTATLLLCSFSSLRSSAWFKIRYLVAAVVFTLEGRFCGNTFWAWEEGYQIVCVFGTLPIRFLSEGSPGQIYFIFGGLQWVSQRGRVPPFVSSSCPCEAPRGLKNYSGRAVRPFFKVIFCEHEALLEEEGYHEVCVFGTLPISFLAGRCMVVCGRRFRMFAVSFATKQGLFFRRNSLIVCVSAKLRVTQKNEPHRRAFVCEHVLAQYSAVTPSIFSLRCN